MNQWSTVQLVLVISIVKCKFTLEHEYWNW